MMWGPYADGWWSLVMGLIWLAFLALIIVGAVLVIRSFTRNDQRAAPTATSKTALDILAERFARGEIDQGEYEERRRLLEGPR